jgi:DNA mismatch repair protein MutL
LDVDPNRTDVNVHPTKQQMKFADERAVFSFIFHTVKEGLRRAKIARGDLAEGDSGGGGIIADLYGDGNNIPNRYDNGNNMPAGYNSGDNMSGGYDGGNNIPDRYGIADGGPVAPETREPMPHPTLYQPSLFGQAPSPLISRQSTSYPQSPSDSLAAISDISEAGGQMPQEFIQCYQIHGMFILAPIKNGILLIDQHAAHERVLYEQALLDMEAGRPVSQQLLFPIVFEMGGTERAVLASGREYFVNLGFEISDFGGNAVSVSALPAFLKDGQAEGAIREMVRYLLEGRDPEKLKEPQKRFAAAFACGAAIKTGQKLSQEEMNALINTLFSANNPYTCPHGRPTLVRISVDELARRFLRT